MENRLGLAFFLWVMSLAAAAMQYILRIPIEARVILLLVQVSLLLGAAGLWFGPLLYRRNW